MNPAKPPHHSRPSCPARARLARLGLVLALLILLLPRLPGQFRLGGGFSWPVYAEAAPATGTSQSQLRALITGESAEMTGQSLYLVRHMRIQSYAPDGTTNVIARAPECLLNQSERSASSTNRLEVEAGQGQILISGLGFHCNLTNIYLVISNQVETLIRQELLQSARQTKPFLPQEVLRAPAPVTTSAATNHVRILSDRLLLDSPSNRVLYLGHVRVTSPQVDLTCDQLTIRRATNGSIENILAENNVVIFSKEDRSTARGGRALYTLADQVESLSLLGQPAEWSDGWRQAEAHRFVFNLTDNTLQASGHAHIQIPRGILSQTNWALNAPPPITAPETLKTNQLLVVSAEFLHVQFPSDTQPARSILARTNVLVLNQEDGSRAAAQQASLSEATGIVELHGQASWISSQRRIKAEHLFLDRTNQIFSASENAYLWLPISTLNTSSTTLPVAPAELDPARSPVPQFLEVFADRYDYEPGRLRFQGQVRGRLLERDLLQGRLSCQDLALFFSNRLQRVLAQDQVLLQQFPVPAPNCSSLERTLRCESLAMLTASNGPLDRVIARTNVVISQTELSLDDPAPLTTWLLAQTVTATFSGPTNQLEQAMAEEDVRITQGLRHAEGQLAVYDAQRNAVELSGRPTADAPEGRITEAEVLIWDRNLNKFIVRKAKAQGSPLAAPSPELQPLLRP